MPQQGSQKKNNFLYHSERLIIIKEVRTFMYIELKINGGIKYTDDFIAVISSLATTVSQRNNFL